MGGLNDDNLEVLILKIIIKKNNFEHFDLLFKLLTSWGVYINLPEYMKYLLERKVLTKEREGIYLVTKFGRELAEKKSINELILSIDNEVESFRKENALEFIDKYKIE